MLLKRHFVMLLFLVSLAPFCCNADAPVYGSNDEAGQYAEFNDIRMYYESYGCGEPVLLIHGNGQSIAAMASQIEYFSQDHMVIVADSRAHGKTGFGTDPLTYVQMMEDYNDLLEQLGIGKVQVFGWSDGGILSLLLAIHHPEKIDKMALMGANLRPDQTAIEAWVPGLLNPLSESVDNMITDGDTSQNWQHQRQMLDLLMTQPDIAVESLQQIKIPVLVMAGDKDIIRARHTLEIFENLPNAHLAILPGQTHWAPTTDAAGFNALLGRFFETPYARPTSREILEQELGSGE